MKSCLLIVSVIAVLLTSSSAAWAGVIYVRHHAGPTFDGRSWATAFDTVHDAVDAAAHGDEVWVARGLYVENIALKSGVALYGGFAGFETDRSQRDWRTYVTMLDGDRGGSVIDVAKDASASTRLDGFTITNGQALLGGGVYCNQRSAPIIANNRIAGNLAQNEGGGIYCNLESGPTIINNIICDNGAITAGGGICSTSGVPTIAGNIIAGNSALIGGGMCVGGSGLITREVVSNNTIFANSATKGGGLYCRPDSSIQAANNIIAFNSSGVYKEAGAGVPRLRYNCVYGNDRGDYTNLVAGATDISADPRFASRKYGNLHIQPNSPCKEAGGNSEIVAGVSDIDGQTRIVGTVDIGADESDGTTWPMTPRVVRVSVTGSDSNDGSGWDSAHAKRTIESAISAAAQAGGEVWVKAGSYYETIVLRDYVHVYGGFDGSESTAGARDPASNLTRIDPAGGWSCVTAQFLGHRTSTIDGFTLANGRAFYGGGVFCDHASPVITNNTITQCLAESKGGGIYLANSSALVQSNTISGNSSLASGGAIHCDRGSPDILANVLTGNTACLNGGGIYASADSMARIVNNKLLANTHDPAIPGAWGGAVCLGSYLSVSMSNNTISGNAASGGGGALYCNPFGSINLTNSIVAFNSPGIWADDAVTVSGVRKNCVYGNSGYNYKDFAGGTGDIVQDPLFVNRAAGDYHLVASSPCIEAAEAATAPAGDFEGNPRPLDGNANLVSLPDIGCYEYARPFTTIPLAKALPDGALVAITGMISTAVLEGRFYVETPDRVAGIGVIGTCSAVGRWVTVEGTMTTASGERLVLAYNVIEMAEIASD